jgi:N-acetylmuramoyl-L-alanine amidase
VNIDRHSHRAQAFSQRIRFLVLHYTELDLASSVRALTGASVSAHYLVSDALPPVIYGLVDETCRAWHAGASHWQGRDNLNDTSIGIEIVNPGVSINPDGTLAWYAFPAEQIDAVAELAREIIARYEIDPTCVVAHSDIAPRRKYDPGPLFPWRQLHAVGVGAWPDSAPGPGTDGAAGRCAALTAETIRELQGKLGRYGYGLAQTGVLDETTKAVLRAFQLHFRPADFSGEVDAQTVALLDGLLLRYGR